MDVAAGDTIHAPPLHFRRGRVLKRQAITDNVLPRKLDELDQQPVRQLDLCPPTVENLIEPEDLGVKLSLI